MNDINYLFESPLQTRIRTMNFSYDPRFIWQWGAKQYMDIDLLKKLLGEE